MMILSNLDATMMVASHKLSELSGPIFAAFNANKVVNDIKAGGNSLSGASNAVVKGSASIYTFIEYLGLSVALIALLASFVLINFGGKMRDDAKSRIATAILSVAGVAASASIVTWFYALGSGAIK